MNCKNALTKIEQEIKQYEPYIKRVAESLTPCYSSIRDDLAQIMRIAIWQNPCKHPALTKKIIVCRAIDFLRSYNKTWVLTKYPVKIVSYELLGDLGLAHSSPPHSKRITDDILVEQLLVSLPESERNIIAEHYLDDILLKDIAESRGLHRSRISQIKSTGLARMRRRAERK